MNKNLIVCKDPYYSMAKVALIFYPDSIYPNYYFKDADIYCFEPQKVIYDILSKNINENSIKNCKLYNNCVGHKNTDTTLSKYLYDEYDLEVKYNIKNKFKCINKIKIYLSN